MKNKFIVASLSLLPLFAQAQFGDLIKKGIKKGVDKGKSLVLSSNDQARDRLDSTDFNYAISVIDNSGMMDIRDAGESFTKTADFVSNNFLKDQSKVTPAQKSRNTLDAAEKFYENRLYRMAELYFLDAKLSYETNKLTNNINYSKVHADLGLLYATMGRYSAASQYSGEALSMREKMLGKNSKAYACSLNNNAVLFQEMARYNEAEQYFQGALVLVKSALGEQSEEYAIVLNNQAIFFSKIGRYDQAVEKLKSAIAILGQQQKNDTRNTVGFQSNLALLYQKTGKFQDAEAIYLRLEKALKVQSSNPFYAGVLDNLALLYIQMNKLDKVETYFKQSAQVYKDRFGPQNPNYAKVLNDLGNFYRMQTRFAEAEQTLTESLTIRMGTLDRSEE